MFLLLAMIILGTITMVNLFVVVIISDLTDLQHEVRCPIKCIDSLFLKESRVS